MTPEELRELLKLHRVHMTWCNVCGRVSGSEDHIADLLMPDGVDYLLQAREV